MNRLGKRFQNESKTGGTAHNGWHTLMSFDDSIADYDRIPVWTIFDQKGIDGGPMGTQQGGSFECGNYTTDLPDEIRAWDGWSDDNQVEIERGWVLKGDTLEDLANKIIEFDDKMVYDNPQGHLRRVPRLLRCRQGRALRPRAVGREQALRVRPVLRHLHLSRLLLHAGRPEEERVRAGGGPGG